MRRLTLYLDTSVLNFIFEEEDLEKRRATEKLFREIKQEKFREVFVSTMTVREIEAAPISKRQKMIELIKNYNLKVLELDEEVERLAKRYVDNHIIPEKYDKDAIHIAVAVVNNLDVVVSWNLEHMVKVRTRLEVNGVNRLEGYHEIEISTPQEVIESES